MENFLSGQELASRLGVKPQALVEWEHELKLEVPCQGQQRMYDDDMIAVFEIVKDLRDDGNGFRTITRVIGGPQLQSTGSATALATRPPMAQVIEAPDEELYESAEVWQSRYVRTTYVIERLEAAIKERDRLMNELQRENGRLRQSESQAFAFLSDTAHELKAPLSAIMGYSELMQKGRFGKLEAEQAEIQALITRRALELKELINALQQTAQQAELDFSCAPQVINPGPILAEAILTLKAQADLKQQAIHALIPAGLPHALADPARLRQITLNILSNAIRYTPAGGRISLSVQVSGPEQMTISIADNGPGIDAAELPKLFARFYRGGRDETDEGTGLGLGIARKLVEQLGGKLWADSQPGKGATFSFSVPLALRGRTRPLY